MTCTFVGKTLNIWILPLQVVRRIRHLGRAVFVSTLQRVDKVLRNWLSCHCLVHFFSKLTATVARCVRQNKALFPRREIGIGTKPTIHWWVSAKNRGPQSCYHWLPLGVILYVYQVFLRNYSWPLYLFLLLLELPSLSGTLITHFATANTLFYASFREKRSERTNQCLLYLYSSLFYCLIFYYFWRLGVGELVCLHLYRFLNSFMLVQLRKHSQTDVWLIIRLYLVVVFYHVRSLLGLLPGLNLVLRVLGEMHLLPPFCRLVSVDWAETVILLLDRRSISICYLTHSHMINFGGVDTILNGT